METSTPPPALATPWPPTRSTPVLTAVQNNPLLITHDSNTATPQTDWVINIPFIGSQKTPTKTPSPPPVSGREYYLSPSGNDSSSGKSPDEAWATFAKAWTVLQPGDTLTLLDGVYHQELSPSIGGSPDSPMTIRAQNDGKAILDGQGVRVPVYLNGGVGYFIIEGIVARNGAQYVYRIEGNYNELRRVSGFDADTDGNSRVISVAGDYNVVEDCVAGGSGRKMIMVFRGQHNTIRRCIADWREWDGRDMCSAWPYGAGIEFYGASNNIMENVISYGHTPYVGLEIMSSGADSGKGNKILGSMAIASGMKFDGTPMIWGDTRPEPAICPDRISNLYGHPGYMNGIWINASGGIVSDNTLQDILAWGSARYGLGAQIINVSGSEFANNHINRATVFGNGLNNPDPSWGGVVDTSSGVLSLFDSVTNSSVEKVWGGDPITGEGARLTKRYVDGLRTNEDLWPWPMEDRVKAEIGYSVTCRIGTIINDAYADGKAAEGIDMTSRDPNWASNPNNLVVQACNN